MTAIELCRLTLGNISGNWNSSPRLFLLGLPLLLLLIVALLLGKLTWKIRVKSRQIQELQAVITELEKDALKLTAQNDWLVTEMHHRVKNNLQILSSLINSQLSFITDKKVRDALSNSKHRLYALTLVHQKLFQNSMDSCIEISGCIEELVGYLQDEFNSTGQIKFDLDLTTLEVDISFAIPFALIINELMTNTLKFAFPGDQKGNVKISLRTGDHANYELIYADDGVGLPGNIDLLSATSLGRSLIMGLSRQIKAQVKVDNSNGLEIKMIFSAPREQQGHFGIC